MNGPGHLKGRLRNLCSNHIYSTGHSRFHGQRYRSDTFIGYSSFNSLKQFFKELKLRWWFERLLIALSFTLILRTYKRPPASAITKIPVYKLLYKMLLYETLSNVMCGCHPAHVLYSCHVPSVRVIWNQIVSLWCSFKIVSTWRLCSITITDCDYALFQCCSVVNVHELLWHDYSHCQVHFTMCRACSRFEVPFDACILWLNFNLFFHSQSVCTKWK